MKLLLKNIMIEKGLSLRKMENLTGVSKSALSRICRGEESPTLEEVENIAKGLHMRITDLFDSEYK